MATKLKSTKQSEGTVTFSGLISWVGMLFLNYAALCAIVCLAITVINPTFFNELVNVFSMVLYGESEASWSTTLQILSLSLLLITALVMTFAFREKRKAFEQSVSSLLKSIWVEFKIVIFLSVILLAYFFSNTWVLLLTVLFTVYLLCLDIGHNRRFFGHNVIRSILNSLEQGKREMSFEVLFSKRLYNVIFVILGVICLATILFALLFYNVQNSKIEERMFYLMGFFLIIFAVAGMVGAVSWYSLTMKKDYQDLGQIMRQIEKMYTGNLDAVNHVPPMSNFYDMAMQLNMIRTGIQKAVDEGIKADKTKVELITNVSHDIKTPLTSIITYIELLKHEPELSEVSRDFVNTISNKADRLSHIVQDVFEISKAATGNLSLDSQQLDVGKLLRQTMVEMDEDMKNAPITWRVEITDTPAIIYADGQKLYRVFQNLIRNCTQYALEGSRAYIAMTIAKATVNVVIRNISKKELEPSAAEYLTGRFVRGDQTRSSEGSGLGLSIAQSFTEACGGKFTLRTDSDIFYTLVQFPLVEKDVPTTSGNLPLSPADVAPSAAAYPYPVNSPQDTVPEPSGNDYTASVSSSFSDLTVSQLSPTQNN